MMASDLLAPVVVRFLSLHAGELCSNAAIDTWAINTLASASGITGALVKSVGNTHALLEKRSMELIL